MANKKRVKISKEKFTALWLNGTPLADIAREFGIGYSNAAQIRQRLLLPKRSKSYIIIED
jgi:hypothetical protein